MKRNLTAGAIIFLSAFAVFYIYDEITNWQELGEIIRYVLLGLPLGILLICLSIYNQKLDYKNRVGFTFLGWIAATVLLLPPFLIYLLFIK